MATQSAAVDFKAFKQLIEKTPTHGTQVLQTNQPAYIAMHAVVDAVGAHVRVLEEWLNQPNVFCVPVYHETGVMSPRAADDGTGNRYGLGISKRQGRWRVIAYRWGDVRPQSRAYRKPWLEASVADRVATLGEIAGLFDRLKEGARGVLHRAADFEFRFDQLQRLTAELKPAPRS